MGERTLGCSLFSPVVCEPFKGKGKGMWNPRPGAGGEGKRDGDCHEETGKAPNDQEGNSHRTWGGQVWKPTDSE